MQSQIVLRDIQIHIPITVLHAQRPETEGIHPIGTQINGRIFQKQVAPDLPEAALVLTDVFHVRPVRPFDFICKTGGITLLPFPLRHDFKEKFPLFLSHFSLIRNRSRQLLQRDSDFLRIFRIRNMAQRIDSMLHCKKKKSDDHRHACCVKKPLSLPGQEEGCCHKQQTKRPVVAQKGSPKQRQEPLDLPGAIRQPSFLTHRIKQQHGQPEQGAGIERILPQDHRIGGEIRHDHCVTDPRCQNPPPHSRALQPVKQSRKRSRQAYRLHHRIAENRRI